MARVKSSHLRDVKYDEDMETLKIKFFDGSAYEYEEVSKSEHTKLMLALSKGKNFWKNIRQDKITIQVEQGRRPTPHRKRK